MTGPHWMPIAWRQLGVRELAGDADEPRIVDYHQATSLKATDDEVPWCSAFACWVMREAHVPNPRSASARSWLAWGQTGSERYGVVTILQRGTNPAQGHVGFLLDGDGASIWLLAGNQGDAVSVARFDRTRVLGFRWPIE